jgi:hypothetical protein
MKETQKRRISASDLPLGSKSDPPFPPPMFRPVRAFLNVCSRPRNFRIDRLTEGWRRSPPLYGPSAELYCVYRALFGTRCDSRRMGVVTYLNAKPSVDLDLAFVVLPYDAKLNDAFWDLNDRKSLFVLWISRQKI